MQEVLLMWAHRNDYEHKFVEVFTSRNQLDEFLKNHPEVSLDEITLHEVNPR